MESTVIVIFGILVYQLTQTRDPSWTCPTTDWSSSPSASAKPASWCGRTWPPFPASRSTCRTSRRWFAGSHVRDDTALEASFRHDIETVPTLVRIAAARRSRAPRAGCATSGAASRASELGEAPARVPPRLRLEVPRARRARAAASPDIGDTGFTSRTVEVGEWDDPIEACYERGWTDGLPVVPPTDARILRMLQGTRRKPDEVVGNVPPNLLPCTVEKVAINAVMAGCLPEYMPVLLAALEAALEPVFTMHGLLCTTCFSGPIIVVNGPIARRIGMNSGINALGPGQPRQRDHRPRAAADHPQRGRRTAGRARPLHARRPRQVHLLLRRGRERPDVGAAGPGARHPDGAQTP